MFKHIIVNVAPVERLRKFAKAWRLQRDYSQVACITSLPATKVLNLDINDLECVLNTLENYDNAYLTVTTNEKGECVAVVRTNVEGQILAVLWEAPKPQLIPEAGSEWVHHKGLIYTVLDVTSNPDAEKAEEFPRSVFYQGPDGRKWVRTLDSWHKSFTPKA